MGSIGNPKVWVPYVNSKDCSQGFCSLYCPQWCYIIFPPPPPFEFSDNSSGPSFSPLVIAIIGILASAFLLVSYYTIISKYCGNSSNSARASENHDASDQESDNDNNPSLHEPWQVATTGLDESLIKSITVCKYKRGDGLIEGSDCSVCLSEFEEDESVRLLPKCSHAFHVQCIDTWLKSHSNCPLCRANIFFISASPTLLPPIAETPQNQESPQDSQGTSGNVAAARDIERGAGEEEIAQNEHGNGIRKTPLRAFSDLGNLQGRDTVIEITEEGYHQHIIRRSVSMDHSCRSQVSIADMLRISQDGEIIQEEECRGGAGSSKQAAENGRCTHRKKVLHCVRSPAAMKRSFSSGRFFLSRQGRVRDTIMPL